jgi:flagellar biosynthesis anti-sigma factor FlgM
MRIDPNAKTPDVPESKSLSRPGSSNRSSPSRTSQAADDATLPGHAQVQELQKQLDQLPEDRASRVGLLARAIRDGQYNVGADQIAQAMFSAMVARSILTG